MTVSAGPTNSFMGGMKLAGIQDGIVVDIGGTSTDVGIVRSGYPRKRLNQSNIGGIALNFSMPDVLSIPLGGGSRISTQGERFQIGPLSCAKNLREAAMAFGGPLLTLTDAALGCGHLSINGACLEKISLSKNQCQEVMEEAWDQISRLIGRMQDGNEKNLPVIVIGGGAALLPFQEKESFYVPKHAPIANAYGAALAELAGTVDTVISLQNRDAVLADLERRAYQATVDKGALPDTVRLVERFIIPYHYAPNQMARVIMTASGKQA